MRLAQQLYFTLKQLTPQKTAMDLRPFFTNDIVTLNYDNLMPSLLK